MRRVERVELTCESCGEAFHVRPLELKRRNPRFCSVRCRWKVTRGSGAPVWRGGRFRTVDGYTYVKAQWHPFAKKNGYVFIHRLIMEDHLDRYLWPWERVHHKNWNREDNRPQNLEILSRAEHQRAHHPWEIICGRGPREYRRLNMKIRRHRIAMENTLGRPLDDVEVVHHKDLDKGNNDTSNLMVFAGNGDHKKHHVVINRLFTAYLLDVAGYDSVMTAIREKDNGARRSVLLCNPGAMNNA